MKRPGIAVLSMGFLALTALGLGAVTTAAEAQGTGPAGLTAAGPNNWAVLAVNGPVTCTGNQVAGNVGAVGSVVWPRACVDVGRVVLSGSFLGGGTVASGVTVDAATVKAAAANALSVSAATAKLACTLGASCGRSITGSTTLNGLAGQNVLNIPILVTGGGSRITINSPAGSTFIINVSTLWTSLGAFSVALTGGIEPANVLINYAGTVPVTLGSGFSIQGIVLAPRAAVLVSAGSLTPELIAQSVNLSGGGSETGYVSDDFNRPDGPVGASWQDFAEEAMTIANGGLADPSGSSYAAGYWKANGFTNDQYSEARVAADGGPDVLAVLARASGSGATDRQYYQVYWDSSGTLQLGFYANNAKYLGGSYRDIGSPVTRPKTAGDVLRLEVDGSTLRVLVNNVLETSAVDSELTAGSPGLLVFGASKFDSWRGGNLP